MLWSNIKSLQTIHLRKVYSLFGGIQTLKEWPFFNINIRLVRNAYHTRIASPELVPSFLPESFRCQILPNEHAHGLWMTMLVWMWTMWTTMPRACGWPCGCGCGCGPCGRPSPGPVDDPQSDGSVWSSSASASLWKWIKQYFAAWDRKQAWWLS